MRARQTSTRLAILRIQGQSLMIIAHGAGGIAGVFGTRGVREQRTHSFETTDALQTVCRFAVRRIDELGGLERLFCVLRPSRGERPLASGELR